jgi:hypothetical protein
MASSLSFYPRRAASKAIRFSGSRLYKKYLIDPLQDGSPFSVMPSRLLRECAEKRRAVPRMVRNPRKTSHYRSLADYPGPYLVAKLNARASGAGHLNLAIVE